VVALISAVWWVNHREAAASAGDGARRPGTAGGGGSGRGGFGLHTCAPKCS
jgi:hypothetical protein